MAYLGVLVLAYALVGLLLTRRDEMWFNALAVLMFLLMLGHFAQWAPWHILKGHIPPFKEMRVPSRFRLLLVVFVGGWVGIAIDRLPRALAGRFGARFGASARPIIVALGLVGAGDALGYASVVLAPRFTAPAAAPHVTASTRLFYGGSDIVQFIDQPRQNRGRFDCWEEWTFTMGSPQWAGDVPQAKSVDPNVVVEVANRTPNTFSVEVVATERGSVLVNVPYDRGWRTNIGEIKDENKLLVLHVPPGRHVIRLEYWPHGLTAGLVVSALGFGCVALFFVRDRRRRHRAAATV